MKAAHGGESKAYREYRRKWNEHPKKYVVGVFPIHIDLETITQCNLKCFMCFQAYEPAKPASMDIKLFKNIIDEGAKKGLCSVKTQFRGEPLLDARIVGMIKYAKDKGIIEVMFNTNAVLLDANKARDLVEAGLDKIICSVDGCTKKTYESVRIGARFETVLKNIIYLQRHKKDTDSKKPIVKVKMLDTPRNHQEIGEYIKFWSRIADEVAVEDMCELKIEEEDSSPLPDFACAQLWQRLIVLADGDVLPCCRAIYGTNEKLEVLGNAKGKCISEIWHSANLNRLRELHKKGQSHKIRMCRLCGFRKLLVGHIGLFRSL